MRPDDIRPFLRQRPFRPFRLYILEATVYEIRHPEMALLARTTLNIYFPASTSPFPLAESFVTIALLHITKVEPMPIMPPSNGS